MKRLFKFYDYLFYCTYHFLNKIRKNGEREDDVVWVFSGFLTFIGIILVLEVFRLLIFTQVIHWRPPVPLMMIIALGLVALTMYLNRRYFLKENRFLFILEEYGPEPSYKHIIVGVISFIIATCIILIWAAIKVLIWDSMHK